MILLKKKNHFPGKPVAFYFCAGASNFCAEDCPSRPRRTHDHTRRKHQNAETGNRRTLEDDRKCGGDICRTDQPERLWRHEHVYWRAASSAITARKIQEAVRSNGYGRVLRHGWQSHCCLNCHNALERFNIVFLLLLLEVPWFYNQKQQDCSATS